MFVHSRMRPRFAAMSSSALARILSDDYLLALSSINPPSNTPSTIVGTDARDNVLH